MIGLVGTTNGMLQLIDESVCTPIVIHDSEGHEKVIDNGSVHLQFNDPKTGKLLLETTMQIGKEPTFLLTPGVWRDYVLQQPVDKILAIGLMPMVSTQLQDQVQLWSKFIKGSDGRYSAIRIVASTSSSGLLQQSQLNAICHFFVIPDMSIYSPWLRQLIKGGEQARAENFDGAVLDYARACEMFIGDFLRASLRRVQGLDDKRIKKVLETPIGDRVAKLLPVLTADITACSDAQQAWQIDVANVRNDKIAHDSSDVTKEEVQRAYDSAYWFIRAIQSQCKFEEGLRWNFWAIRSEAGEVPSRTQDGDN